MARHLREARLRTDADEPYPGVLPGRWMTAASLADQVLAGWLLKGSGTAVRGRVLPDADFEFRGGEATGGTRLAQRKWVLQFVATHPLQRTGQHDRHPAQGNR